MILKICGSYEDLRSLRVFLQAIFLMRDLKLEDHPSLVVCDCYFVQSEELIRCMQYECVFSNHLYTGCPRRKGPNFGRVFLRSNYTDITQNTYIQSSMVTEILAREV